MNNIGRKIKNDYCNGYLSRDYDLDGATVEAEGHDWIAVRTSSGIVYFEQFKNISKKEIDTLIDKWCTESEED